MADDLTLDHIDDVFGNVGGEIGDAFQVPRCGEEQEIGLDESRILADLVLGLCDDLEVVVIDGVVFRADPPRQGRIAKA